MADGSRRAFSMANAPHESMIELHLRLIEGGKFTSFVFNEMKEKSIHRIEGPIGQFYLRAKRVFMLIQRSARTKDVPCNTTPLQRIYNVVATVRYLIQEKVEKF